jgi:hypothetical protein
MAGSAVKNNGAVHDGECGPLRRLKRIAPFVLSFVAEVLMADILYGVIFYVGTWTAKAGVVTGALCWLGFVLVVNNAYTSVGRC